MIDVSQSKGERSDSDLEAWLELVGRTGETPSHSPVYRMKLAGPTPAGLKALPRDHRPRTPGRGAEIMQGHWRFGGSAVETPEGHAPWGPPFPTAHFADCIHRFHWLRDVAGEGEAGQARARALCVSWVDRYGKWEPFAWRVAVAADRLINLLSAGPWLLGGLEGQAREDMLDAMARHARHLQQSGGDEPEPRARFRIAVAQVIAGAVMDIPQMVSDGLVSLERECGAQILADGGHVSRSPEALAEALIDLGAVEDLLLRLGLEAPNFLTRLQTRMASMLSFLTLPGGGLLPVNGGGEGANGLSAAALRPHGEVSAKYSFARLSGFQRVQAETLTLFMDSGAGPDSQYGGQAHAGALAIFVADGGETIVTSCAAYPEMEPMVREAARRTAAHSVLSLPTEESAVFQRDSKTGLKAPVGPIGISARRLEENDQYLLEGQHSGWRDKFGLLYRRRLYVSRDGSRITGEDSLSRPVSDSTPISPRPIAYSVRFHLHPDVQLAPGQDQRTVFLGLPKQKNVWRFRSEALLKVEDSRYWGGGSTQRSLQLVIDGDASPTGDGSKSPNRVRWAFLRLESVE